MMQNRISIWRNRDQPDEMHMTILLSDKELQALQDIVVWDHLPIAEAYDKLRLQQKAAQNKK